uniref:hypothetical protein n=1 Tax=Methylobacterium sp. B34 TaxID=95563 RepID=UPI000FE1432F|nr:hypothetical protein [Methylobacterium sp. B34]
MSATIWGENTGMPEARKASSAVAGYSTWNFWGVSAAASFMRRHANWPMERPNFSTNSVSPMVASNGTNSPSGRQYSSESNQGAKNTSNPFAGAPW